MEHQAADVEMPAARLGHGDGPAPAAAPAARPGAHWGFLAFFLGYGGSYLATLALTAVGQGAFDPDEPPRAWPPLMLAFVPNLLLGAAPAVMSRWRGRGPRRDYGLVPTVRDVKVGLACGGVSLLLGLALSVPLTLLSGEKTHWDGLAGIGGNGPAWLLLYSVYLVIGAPLTEEMLCRGALWRALAHYQVPRPAILGLTALVFAFLHLDPSKVGSLFAQGLAIGTARMITGRVGASTVAHAVNNAFPAVSGYLIAVSA